jgi:hypothetical protein
MPTVWDEPLSPEEAALLAPFVTNLEQPVFGLRNLPEMVKCESYGLATFGPESMPQRSPEHNHTCYEKGWQSPVILDE